MQVKSNIQTIIPRMALAVVGFAFTLGLVCPAVNNVSADEVARVSSGTSSLGVSLTPAPTMEVQPNTSGLTTATATSQLNVTTTDIEKFSVYLSTTNGESTLVGKYPGNTQVINPVSSSLQLANFTANTWGYSLATSAPTSTTLFSAVPTTNTNPVLADVIPSGNDNFYLSIGTAIDLSLPTDTYKNELTVSVIATPAVIYFEGITTMQQMTPTICANATVGDTTRLTDSRDGKKYWVAKLADNNCWMTQNLALDLSPSVTLTSADSDVSSYTPTQTTYQNVTTNSGGKEFEVTVDYSWSFGEKVLTAPDSGNRAYGSDLDAYTGTDGTTILTDVTGWEPTYKSSVTTNTDLSIDVASQTYDAHYLLGNYYTFATAIANTVTGFGDKSNNDEGYDNTDAPGSICPKGWKLPTSGDNNGSGSFKYLQNANGFTDAYFFMGGSVIGDIDVGDSLYYWSSMILDWESAYYLDYNSWNWSDYSPVAGYTYGGFSVRCLAR